MTQRLSAVASEDVTRLDERRKTHFLSRPADGYAMILESEHRRRDGNLKEARHWMDMALRRIPHQLNVHFANSLLLVSEGQSTEASVLMRELFTTNWPSREKIANQLVGLLRSNEGRKWSPTERVEFLEQALPLENDAILSVGTLMVQKGFEELYVGALEKRLNQEPDNSEIRHAFVAQLMSREKWSERAAREMTQLIARDGKSAKALQLQGMLFERESKPLQAWAMYAEAISLDPRYVRALLGEVRLRMQLGRGSVGEGREAIGAIRSLLGNDYRLTAEYHRVLSIAAELEGEVDECLMEMRMAVRARPDGAGYWKRAIAIAETNGRTLEALQIAEQWSGRMDSNHAEAREVLKRLRNANP